MLNLLGDAWFPGGRAVAEGPLEPDWRLVLGHPRAKLHLYGKAQARPGRKMGHVTVLGDTLAECLETAAAIERDLGLR
jgi:5-(carboxyamino)imidazole ribonucleotide synthase